MVVVDAVVLAPEVVVLIEVELAALEEEVVEAEVELAGALVEPLALAEPWKVNCKLKLGSPLLSVILKAVGSRRQGGRRSQVVVVPLAPAILRGQ